MVNDALASFGIRLWWRHIESVAAPRGVVMHDVDPPPGAGAFFGKVHAGALMAPRGVGVITNGGAREFPEVEARGFQVYAKPGTPPAELSQRLKDLMDFDADSLHEGAKPWNRRINEY